MPATTPRVGDPRPPLERVLILSPRPRCPFVFPILLPRARDEQSRAEHRRRCADHPSLSAPFPLPRADSPHPEAPQPLHEPDRASPRPNRPGAAPWPLRPRAERQAAAPLLCRCRRRRPPQTHVPRLCEPLRAADALCQADLRAAPLRRRPASTLARTSLGMAAVCPARRALPPVLLRPNQGRGELPPDALILPGPFPNLHRLPPHRNDRSLAARAAAPPLPPYRPPPTPALASNRP